MKIKICNLGPVKEADIDLRPLTVFIGPNNTGKSWTAYAVSAILGPYGWRQYLRRCDAERVAKVYPDLYRAIDEAVNQGSAKLDLVQFADKYAEIYIQDVALQAPKWMQNFIGARQVSFEKLEVSVNLSEVKSGILQLAKEIPIEVKLGVNRREEQEPLFTIVKEKDSSILYLYTQGNLLEKLPMQAIVETVIANVFRVLHKAFYPNVFVLPTERATFSAMSFRRETRTVSEKNLEVTTDLNEQQEKQKLLPIPVSNFIVSSESFARQASLIERKAAAKQAPSIQFFLDLADLLEEAVLGGKLEYSTPEPKEHRELLFEVEDNVELEMSAASSMVKGLSALVLYLRYTVTSGELLVIDEPEMNLHPKAQARLTEFLGMLVNAGLNVLITTHSPYIVDHLVNLMRAAERDNKEEIKEKFYLKKTNAFVSKNDVSVHLFTKEGQTQNVLNRETGLIDWNTFGQISEEVNKIYYEIE